MSINRNKRDLLKRDQALNDSTSGQLGDEPRSKPSPAELFEPNTDDSIRDLQIRAARKKVQRFLIAYIRKVFSLADCRLASNRNLLPD
jgi:hypothetical protein